MVGKDSWWTIPVASLVIVFSAVLVLLCGQRDAQADARFPLAELTARQLG